MYLKYQASRLKPRFIIFDVGSCDGKQFLRRCQTDASTVVYAFEPEPESYQAVLRNTAGLRNFHAFPMAVSSVDGIRTFNVTSVVGNHSLYEFVDDVNETWKAPYAEQMPSWVPDFQEKRSITVEATRLDTFITRMHIPYVSYLHIDAQGEDLKVLESLGDKMSLVRAGVIEVCLKPLYKGHFTKDEAIAFLTSNGFVIKGIESEHFGLVENVYYERA
jgi:FkbM family methyltransferase